METVVGVAAVLFLFKTGVAAVSSVACAISGSHTADREAKAYIEMQCADMACIDAFGKWADEFKKEASS